MTYFKTAISEQGQLRAALEDSIMRKGSPAAAGSKILEVFLAPFDAAVVQRLRANNVAIVGITEMDEFGIAPVEGDSPLSGAVRALLDGACDIALCNDFSGTVKRQAAENGLCYLHPRYGTVSRYGLIPSVSSMDQIGVLAQDAATCFRVLEMIAGHDERDGTSLPQEKYSFNSGAGELAIALPPQLWEGSRVRESLAKKAALTDRMPEFFSLYAPVQYILASAEISNNINRYDGIKFGYRSPQFSNLNELYLNTRTEGFGLDTKLAAIMGAYVLSQEQYEPYYDQAMRLRRRIRDELAFTQNTLLALPANRAGDAFERSALYGPATLAGLACLALSVGGEGVLLYGDENLLATFAKEGL